MTIHMNDIPRGDIAPPGARKSPTRSAMLRNSFGRRGFLKALGVGAIAMSINALSLIPKLTPGAFAAPSTWGKCSDYKDWDNKHWAECNPYASGRPAISHSYCASNNYHRTDSVVTGSGSGRRRVRYYQRPTSCKNKNAWVWNIKNDRSPPNYRDRRCSDGRLVISRVSDGVVTGRSNTVCETILPRTGEPTPVTPDST